MAARICYNGPAHSCFIPARLLPSSQRRKSWILERTCPDPVASLVWYLVGVFFRIVELVRTPWLDSLGWYFGWLNLFGESHG